MNWEGQKCTNLILPSLVVKSVELHPASLLCTDPHWRRDQAVVLPSHHQRGENRRAVSPPPASLRGTAHRFLLAESCDVAVHHRLDSVRLRIKTVVSHLQFLFVNSSVGEWCLEEVLVESAVRHGTVETADGPDADGEGFGLQRPHDVAVALRLQRQRRRTAESLWLRLVEAPSLLRPRSLPVLHNSCQTWTTSKWEYCNKSCDELTFQLIF